MAAFAHEPGQSAAADETFLDRLVAYTVLGADGGLYSYLPSGQLMPNDVGVAFKDAGCTGPAYISPGVSISPLLLAATGGAFRIVLRSLSEDSMGPARAWKVTSDWSVVPKIPPTYYRLGESGCVAAQVDPGDVLLALRDVPTPPDGVGVLTIG